MTATMKALRIAFGSAAAVTMLVALGACDGASTTSVESVDDGATGGSGTTVITGDGGDAIYSDPDGSISFSGTSPDGSDISFSTG